MDVARLFSSKNFAKRGAPGHVYTCWGAAWKERFYANVSLKDEVSDRSDIAFYDYSRENSVFLWLLLSGAGGQKCVSKLFHLCVQLYRW